MTRDEIIRMAREAGFADGMAEIMGLEGFARFAALVARHVLEGSYPEMIAYVAAAEREACAKVCDELAQKDKLSNYYAVAAKAIRERNNNV